MPSQFDSRIERSANAKFPAEKGRYHLYVMYSCPYACRVLAARNLKGLEDMVGLSVTHLVDQRTRPDNENDQHMGWTFVDPEKTPSVTGMNDMHYPTTGCIPDTVNHVNFIRDLYEMADPTSRTFSVPVLWDKKKRTIVSDSSTDIVRMLDSAFEELAPSKFQLYPDELGGEIDASNDGIVAEVNRGFFTHALASTTEVAQISLAKFFTTIAKLDEMLARQRYLVGNTLTEADVSMFHTLIRFDHIQKKTNEQQLTQFQNIVGYLRDIYQTPGIASTVNWDHMEFAKVNRLPDAPASEGPFVEYSSPHDRAALA
ncbi:hypothetical protein PPTG_07010 [Phytophthora nicotianae INRA-310]|uniref:GST C-terminal domain-containing protein n=2 Tax=Phytophthora nicotianae TaxID=4792 RepID=W2QRL1_PHYN3|nr:hypothetical protein PPTG_07010 [Phytophthora nicotianae INRA-310]ETN15817.1 hypothetical protein PPTG_07010 [Phytophthora nicotianae INRA-310]KUF76683.1 Glutathionyl-hydroquinone reductase YqjG [Phytophthora nicotianae]